MNSRKFLSSDERSHLENLLIQSLETDTRNSVLILTALNTGARASELLALKWSDIDFKSGEIFIKTLKSGRDRSVVVPKLVIQALQRLKAMFCDAGPTDRLFQISYARLVDIWHLYRPNAEKPFHCLRHTFAMRAYERTSDIRFVQYALGHRSIANTMVYAEYSYNAQEFKKLMRIR